VVPRKHSIRRPRPIAGCCYLANLITLSKILSPIYAATYDLRRAGDPRSCPNFCLWEMPVNIYIYTQSDKAAHGVSDLDQRQQTRHSQQGCAFWGCEQCSPKFWKKLNKTEILAPMHSTFKRERSFVRGLQPRGYIAECFRLFRVVVKGPKRWFLLIGFSIPLSPNFCLWEILVYIHNAICTARPIWTKDGQNASSRARMCLLWLSTMFPKLNFKDQTAKTDIFGAWIGLSSPNSNISTADKDICTKFCWKMHHMQCGRCQWPKIKTGS